MSAANPGKLPLLLATYESGVQYLGSAARKDSIRHAIEALPFQYGSSWQSESSIACALQTAVLDWRTWALGAAVTCTAGQLLRERLAVRLGVFGGRDGHPLPKGLLPRHMNALIVSLSLPLHSSRPF